MNRIKSWFQPPNFGDPDLDANLGILHTILLIVIIATCLASIYYLVAQFRSYTGLILIGSLPPQAFSLFLARRGSVRLASALILGTLYILANILIFRGDGLEDIAIMFYPALILVASLLLPRRGYLYMVGLVLVSVAWMASAQFTGLIQPVVRTPAKIINDLLMTLLILSIIAVVISLLSENLHTNLRRAKRDQQSLREANHLLQQEIAERQHIEAIRQAIYRISEAAHNAQNLFELYKSIHLIICGLMPARNFYISLYDAETDLLTTPYLADEYDSEWPPYKPGKGLGAYVIRTGEPMLITPDEFSRLESAGEVEILARRMVDWLGVPLKTIHGIIGLMAVQTYQPNERLTDADKEVLMFVSNQVATAIERKLADEERQRLIAKLEAQNAELERFTYTVSHDLKSPLITIRGFADYLRRDLDAGNEERVRQDLNRITQSAEKMQELLSDLLELSRIGRLVNPPEAVSFEVIVEEVTALLQGSLQARGVRVVCNQEMPYVYGDRARLTEVMQNLLENAIKFMGEQAEPFIEIGFQEDDSKEMPIFYVRDNGIGIEPQYREKIFGLFEKLDVRNEGTGIGLALAKRIIEIHGGKIWVDSEGMGRGSTFYFTLPAAPVGFDKLNQRDNAG